MNNIRIILIYNLSTLDLNDRNDADWRESVNINLEGLNSLKKLHLKANTAQVYFSIKNFPSLTNFSLSISGTIDDNIAIKLCEQLPHIEELNLKGNLSYFNFDSLFNLRVLELSGTIDETTFNFELFKNLCNQLEDIQIRLANIDENTFIKLFVDYTFPCLEEFTLNFLQIKRLTKEFLNSFPMLKRLNIFDCNIKVIGHDSFSNLEQLCFLDLSNNHIEIIGIDVFSSLKNLQKVNLSDNNLFVFDPKTIGLRQSAILEIENHNLFYKKNPRKR